MQIWIFLWKPKDEIILSKVQSRSLAELRKMCAELSVADVKMVSVHIQVLKNDINFNSEHWRSKSCAYFEYEHVMYDIVHYEITATICILILFKYLNLNEIKNNIRSILIYEIFLNKMLYESSYF
jgi:hypothetical protein